MKKPPKWVAKEVVIAVHERLLAEHGGAPGLLDEGSLDAALASPKHQFAYEHADVHRLAAAYAYALTQNHPFADGNKRVALTVAGVFMELSGYRLTASEQDAASATRALSSGQIDQVQFAGWLRGCSSKVRVARRRGTMNATTRGRKRTTRK